MRSLPKFSAIVLAWLCATWFSSCTIDNDIFVHSQNPPNSPAFDTLQGLWHHDATVYQPANGIGSNVTVANGGWLKFNPDLTGYDRYLLDSINFTYQLLPGDTTLILNTNPLGVPIYDTLTILRLHATMLNYKTKKKQITWPLNGAYFLIHGLSK